MEVPINRFRCLPSLAATGLLLFGGSLSHAQTQSPLEATPDEAEAAAPLEDDADSTVALDGESESQAANGDAGLDLESTVTAQQQMRKDFELYKNLLTNDMTAEADVVAKRIVELSIRVNGFESSDTAKALTNLAIVQHRNKDYETAQQNYEAAIGIIERVEDRLNSALVNPLRGLGAAQLASGRPDRALDTFGRARHVSHVNEGPHNLDQVGILESLAEIYVYIGELEEAYSLQDRIYHLYARRYDTSSEEILPALYKRAEWQHRLRLYGRERDTYRRIIKIIEKNQGKESLDLIRPLTGLSRAFLYVGDIDRDYHRDSTLTTGEIFAKRAKRIVEDHPDATWELKEKTFLALGDFYIFSAKAGKARQTYQETWDLLTEDEERFINRYNHLETLVMLQDAYPPKYFGMDEDSPPVEDDEQFLQGKIVTKFTVSTRGQPREFEIIEVHPEGLEDMEKAVLREMRRLIYRPRMQDREVVDTQNMIYTHEFFYREADLPTTEEDGEPEVPNSDEDEGDSEAAE